MWGSPTLSIRKLTASLSVKKCLPPSSSTPLVFVGCYIVPHVLDLVATLLQGLPCTHPEIVLFAISFLTTGAICIYRVKCCRLGNERK